MFKIAKTNNQKVIKEFLKKQKKNNNTDSLKKLKESKKFVEDENNNIKNELDTQSKDQIIDQIFKSIENNNNNNSKVIKKNDSILLDDNGNTHLNNDENTNLTYSETETNLNSQNKSINLNENNNNKQNRFLYEFNNNDFEPENTNKFNKEKMASFLENFSDIENGSDKEKKNKNKNKKKPLIKKPTEEDIICNIQYTDDESNVDNNYKVKNNNNNNIENINSNTQNVNKILENIKNSDSDSDKEKNKINFFDDDDDTINTKIVNNKDKVEVNNDQINTMTSKENRHLNLFGKQTFNLQESNMDELNDSYTEKMLKDIDKYRGTQKEDDDNQNKN